MKTLSRNPFFRLLASLLLLGGLTLASPARAAELEMEITVSRLNDYLLFFYTGRGEAAEKAGDDWVSGAAMKLGIGIYVIHRGDKAVLYDTLTTPAQARWVKNYLETELGIKYFTVIQSHWHLDHVAGNEAFKGHDIISLDLTRQIMQEKKAAIEAGEEWGPPPINPLVVPNVAYENAMTYYLDDLELRLMHFHIHSRDANLVYLPRDKILLCGDTLEDTLTYMVDIPGLPDHLKGLKVLREMDLAAIYPNHGDPEVIRDGGYDKTFIDATANYIRRMLSRAHDEKYLEGKLEDYVGDSLEKGWVHLWEPYREVHQMNLKLVHEYYQDKPLPELD